MFLKRLELFNFRNYKSAVFEPEEKTLILGANGQGKTNLLEAICLVVTGGSFRVNNKDSIIYENERESVIRSLWETGESSSVEQNRQNFISLNVQRSGEKNLYLDKKRTRFSYITQYFPLVLFSPESLNLLKNSADERRRWLDSWLLTQGLSSAVSEFKKSFRQKRSLLHHIKTGRLKTDQARVLLDSANESFIKQSVNLVRNRRQCLRRLLDFMKESAGHLLYRSGRKESSYEDFLNLKYVAKGVEGEEDIGEETFSSLIEENVEKEMESGVCLYGAHRDDFQILLHGKDARYYCSQGQLRILLLALITGQLGWFREVKDKTPLLLLDDVFSEIDNFFCYNLLYYLESFSSQMLITSTQVPEYFSRKNKVNVVNIKQATIKRESIYEGRAPVFV